MSDNQKNKLPFPARDIVTSNQVSTLLQIAGFALHSLKSAPSFDDGVTPELDGGCKTSAEALFISTCSKLDDLLADTDRWSFALQDSLEVKLQAMYEQNRLFLAEQTKAAAQLSLPSFTYKPTLVRLPITGEWVAHLGSLEDIDHSIVGIGATPAAAIESFNAIFTGDPLPEHIIHWLAEREQAAQKGAKLKAAPTKKKKKTI